MASTNINEVKLAKGTWIAQRSTPIDLSPVSVVHTFDFDVQTMSYEKRPVCFSGFFTVRAPKSISPSTDPKFSHNIEGLVKGVIVSEICTVATSTTTKQMLFVPSYYQQAVIQNVQRKLDESDLIIYNAYMKLHVGMTESMKIEVDEEKHEQLVQLKEAKLSEELFTMGEGQRCFLIKFPPLHDDINVGEKNQRGELGIGALLCRRSNEEAVREAFQSLRSFLEDNSDSGTVLDLENGIGSNVSRLLTAGASKNQIVRELWMLSRASLFIGVSAGVQQPSATGSVFARHQAEYYGVVAAILAAVPIEMATAFWLRRSSRPRFLAFAKGLLNAGVVLLIIATAVGGFQLTVKA